MVDKPLVRPDFLGGGGIGGVGPLHCHDWFFWLVPVHTTGPSKPHHYGMEAQWNIIGEISQRTTGEVRLKLFTPGLCLVGGGDDGLQVVYVYIYIYSHYIYIYMYVCMYNIIYIYIYTQYTQSKESTAKWQKMPRIFKAPNQQPLFILRRWANLFRGWRVPW